MKFILTLATAFLVSIVAGQITSPNPIISIGILGDKPLKNLGFKVNAGRYFLVDDKEDTIRILTEDDRLSFTVKDWKMELKIDTGITSSNYFTLQALDSSANFELASPAIKLLVLYDGSLRIAANAGKIKLVNRLLLEEYIDDVLRAEVGKDHPLELYKVQAVISRTYALDNLNKHKSEFFNLCDKVHCQVYNGKGKYNPYIDSAVAITRGEIITYANKPITAAFHANCGGQTVNSEDVWNHPLPYLRAVTDTFCINSPGARWEKCIKADEWTKYMLETSGLKIKEGDTLLFQFDQPTRTLFYFNDKKKVELKKVRTDWKLRSTFFSVYLTGKDVTLCGRGYGHGVGLCQEGASVMARKGYRYKDIINFYYKGVNIVPINTILTN